MVTTALVARQCLGNVLTVLRVLMHSLCVQQQLNPSALSVMLEHIQICPIITPLAQAALSVPLVLQCTVRAPQLQTLFASRVASWGVGIPISQVLRHAKPAVCVQPAITGWQRARQHPMRSVASAPLAFLALVGVPYLSAVLQVDIVLEALLLLSYVQGGPTVWQVCLLQYSVSRGCSVLLVCQWGLHVPLVSHVQQAQMPRHLAQHCQQTHIILGMGRVV
jgi:hypothetical protein